MEILGLAMLLEFGRRSFLFELEAIFPQEVPFAAHEALDYDSNSRIKLSASAKMLAAHSFTSAQ